jgi:glycerophosphoryl diester phosphodiesterase
MHEPLGLPLGRPTARVGHVRSLPILCGLLVLVTSCATAGTSAPRPVDVEAHRGGLGLTVESTLPAFARALELGVTTLEMDVAITADGRDVITHDHRTDPRRCRDTAPATPGDPLFPYVGRLVRDLTFAQVRTLDCGSQQREGWPDQQLAPGARMPTLAEVADLTRRHGAEDVRFNVETKVEAAAPAETAPREVFVRRVVDEVRRAGIAGRTSIQSFDWGALTLVRTLAPELPRIALTEPDFLEVGRPGASPWLGGLDIDAFGGDVVRAAASRGFSALSPLHGEPQDAVVTAPGYRPFTTRALVDGAHVVGMPVIVWTVDDEPSMNAMLDAGVDGIITDRPDRLRAVLAARGLPLPPAHPAHR